MKNTLLSGILRKKIESYLSEDKNLNNIIHIFLNNCSYILDCKDLREFKYKKNKLNYILKNIVWSKDQYLELDKKKKIQYNCNLITDFNNCTDKKIEYFINMSDENLFNILPPITLILINDIYYVVDGYHRIMSRFRKKEKIKIKCFLGYLPNS